MAVAMLLIPTQLYLFPQVEREGAGGIGTERGREGEGEGEGGIGTEGGREGREREGARGAQGEKGLAQERLIE